MIKFKADLVFSFVLIILGVLIFTESSTYPEKVALFPKILSVIMILLVSVSLFNNFRNKEITKDIPIKENLRIVYILLVGLILYRLILPFLGYIISTVFLAYYTILFLEYKKKKYAFIVSIIFVLLLFFIFNYLIKTRLPTGIIF